MFNHEYKDSHQTSFYNRSDNNADRRKKYKLEGTYTDGKHSDMDPTDSGSSYVQPPVCEESTTSNPEPVMEEAIATPWFVIHSANNNTNGINI